MLSNCCVPYRFSRLQGKVILKLVDFFPFDSGSAYLRNQQQYCSTFHQRTDILTVSKTTEMNPARDMVRSQKARGTQIPPDMSMQGNFENNNPAHIPTVAGNSGHSRVSGTLNLAAGGFRGSFRQKL